MEECGRFEVWYHLPLGGGGVVGWCSDEVR